MNNETIYRLLKCEITWKEAAKKERCGSYVIVGTEEFHVDVDNIMTAIDACLNGKYTIQDLIDWANVIRFSDVFSFETKHSECIIGILDRIEESDEKNNELTRADLNLMKEKLERNEQW